VRTKNDFLRDRVSQGDADDLLGSSHSSARARRRDHLVPMPCRAALRSRTRGGAPREMERDATGVAVALGSALGRHSKVSAARLSSTSRAGVQCASRTQAGSIPGVYRRECVRACNVTCGDRALAVRDRVAQLKYTRCWEKC
jgi:hypothetical protein